MTRTKIAAFALLALLVATSMSGRAEKDLVRPPGTTRYAAMVERLTAFARYDRGEGGHRMELTSIGQSVKGRDLWMVTLRDPSVSPDSTKKLFYLCRQHGHEPASTEAALNFADELIHADAKAPLADCLKRVTIYIVPMANPDGAERFLRHNAHDVDLNRDWVKRTQPETRALYHTILRLHPDLMTDQHELYPSDTRLDFTETVGPKGGAQASVVEANLSTQAVVATCMAAFGDPTHSFQIDDRHPSRLAHRFGSVVAGIPAILFETNRTPAFGRTVADRAAAHERFMTITLRTLAGERDQLLAEAAGEPVPNTPQLPESPTATGLPVGEKEGQ